MNAAQQENSIRTQWRAGAQQFVLQSSGSTGAPASYTLSRTLLEWSAAQTAAALQIQKEDRIYCCLPLDKAGGFMQVIRSEIWQVPLGCDPPDLHPMRRLEPGHPYSITSLTTGQLAAALSVPEETDKLRAFRVVLIGGEALPETLEAAAIQQGIRFLHTYGMTETASHIALRKAGTPHFIPFEGVRIYSAGDDRHLVIDIPGILDAPLHTRDAAIIHADGSFNILGRVDSVINTGGVKIQAEAVEALIHSSGALGERRFIISAKPHPQWGESVVLVAEGLPMSLDLGLLKALIHPNIPYGYPKEVVFMDRLPLTETEKIRRAQIRRILENKPNRDSV